MELTSTSIFVGTIEKVSKTTNKPYQIACFKENLENLYPCKVYAKNPLPQLEVGKKYSLTLELDTYGNLSLINIK